MKRKLILIALMCSSSAFSNAMEMDENTFHKLNTEVYRFKYILDCYWLENTKTQYLYNEYDEKMDGMDLYIYDYEVGYNSEEYKNRSEREKFNRVVMEKKHINIAEGRVTIPEGVTHIGSGYFANHIKLTGIELPSTLLEIGVCAFLNTSIISITIPENITHIRKWCFANCSNLTDVKLPSTLLKIGAYTFFNTNINSITIPESVTRIKSYCFTNCNKLTNINLPSRLKEIGPDDISNKTQEEKMEIARKLLPIEDNATINLNSVQIPEGSQATNTQQ